MLHEGARPAAPASTHSCKCQYLRRAFLPTAVLSPRRMMDSLSSVQKFRSLIVAACQVWTTVTSRNAADESIQQNGNSMALPRPLSPLHLVCGTSHRYPAPRGSTGNTADVAGTLLLTAVFYKHARQILTNNKIHLKNICELSITPVSLPQIFSTRKSLHIDFF